MQVPANWAGPTIQAATLAEKDLARWWTIFEDPTLTSLVERAVESNLDLKLAEARIRQARAVRRGAASGLGPTVAATGSFQRAQSPGSSGTIVGGDTNGQISNQYQAGFDAGWELDIFGGVRRGVEAADADLQAAMETRRDVLVTLTAEVARNYIDLRTFQQRIAIARQNLQAQERSSPTDSPEVRGWICQRPGRGQCPGPGGNHSLPDPASGGIGPADDLQHQHPARSRTGGPVGGIVTDVGDSCWASLRSSGRPVRTASPTPGYPPGRSGDSRCHRADRRGHCGPISQVQRDRRP